MARIGRRSPAVLFARWSVTAAGRGNFHSAWCPLRSYFYGHVSTFSGMALANPYSVGGVLRPSISAIKAVSQPARLFLQGSRSCVCPTGGRAIAKNSGQRQHDIRGCWFHGAGRCRGAISLEIVIFSGCSSRCLGSDRSAIILSYLSLSLKGRIEGLRFTNFPSVMSVQQLLFHVQFDPFRRSRIKGVRRTNATH